MTYIQNKTSLQNRQYSHCVLSNVNFPLYKSTKSHERKKKREQYHAADFDVPPCVYLYQPRARAIREIEKNKAARLCSLLIGQYTDLQEFLRGRWLLQQLPLLLERPGGALGVDAVKQSIELVLLPRVHLKTEQPNISNLDTN